MTDTLTDEQIDALMPADVRRTAKWHKAKWRKFARAILVADAPVAADRSATLEEAAAMCDQLSRLYPREDVAFDKGYSMGAARAAREIRAMKTLAGMGTAAEGAK